MRDLNCELSFDATVLFLLPQETSEDSLRHSLLRIHTFRALSSPAWISLTSPDPVLTAFKLSWELDHLAMRENEFKDLYAELSEQCKKYSCNLLDQCRSSAEVNVLTFSISYLLSRKIGKRNTHSVFLINYSRTGDCHWLAPRPAMVIGDCPPRRKTLWMIASIYFIIITQIAENYTLFIVVNCSF